MRPRYILLGLLCMAVMLLARAPAVAQETSDLFIPRLRPPVHEGFHLLSSRDMRLAQAPSAAQAPAAAGAQGGVPEDLDTIGKKQINPVSDLWSLVTQHDTALFDGDISNADRAFHSFKFQPVLPIELSSKLRFIGRPLFPIVESNPIAEVDATGRVDFDRKTGFGDIQMATILAPAKKSADGLFWGAGLSWAFPSASEDELGTEKWALGPALVGFYFTKSWIFGLFPQHQWSYAGDSDRESVNRTNIQYFLLYQIPNTQWKVGMTPNIMVDWKADDRNKLTWPVGLGATTVKKFGKTPVRILFEVQGFVYRPEDYGPFVNFRILIAPVIPKLIKGTLF